MKEIFKKPYVFWMIGILIAYLAVSVAFSGFATTAVLIVKYASTVNWTKILISVFLTLAIGFLVAVNAVYASIRYRERQHCMKESVVASVGAVGGLATGVCPLCVTGLFPLILSTLGITFSFASLPLGGIEVQLLVIILLTLNLRLLRAF